MLKYSNISKFFDDNKAVDNINLQIEPGTILGLLGRNGAGKTTTVKMGCGLIEPTCGDIIAFNTSVKKNRKEYLKNIGAVLEGNRNIYWKLTPEENMIYFSGIRGIKKRKVESKIKELLTIFDLKDKYDERCENLSRGMQQKVAICCSLIYNPQVLFLDEPTLGLDVESVINIKKIVKELISKNRIVVVTSHDLKFISEVCDRVCIIEKGKIVLDKSVEFLENFYDTIIYNIDIEKNNSKTINKLSTKFKVKYRNKTKDKLRIKINNNNEIVNIIKFLDNNNIKILNINRVNIELEDIFLDVINNKQEEWNYEKVTSNI